MNPGPQGAEGTYTALLKIREVIPEVSFTPFFFFSRLGRLYKGVSTQQVFFFSRLGRLQACIRGQLYNRFSFLLNIRDVVPYVGFLCQVFLLKIGTGSLYHSHIGIRQLFFLSQDHRGGIRGQLHNRFFSSQIPRLGRL